jgi:hypothetical protein
MPRKSNIKELGKQVFQNIVNENDLWKHAEPLGPTKEKLDQMIEVAFMKDLFANHLPVGDNKQELEKYFMDLEQVISTKDYIKLPKDEFPIDDAHGSEDGDSSADGSEFRPPKQYKYYSASLLKQQAQQQCDDNGPDSPDLCIRFSGYNDELELMDEVQSPGDPWSPHGSDSVQDEPEGSGHLQRMAEYSDSTDSEDWSDHSYHSQR